MIPVDLTSSFFDLFDIPASFFVDTESLSEKFRSLQGAVHPDRFAKSTDEERRLSVQQSARINEGYQVLKDPLARARYLLQLQGMDVSSDQCSVVDSGFLMQQMELRESLEAIQDSNDPAGQLLALGASVDAMTQDIVSLIAEMFREQNPKQPGDQHEKIYDYVCRLQFMNKLGEEVQMMEERFI